MSLILEVGEKCPHSIKCPYNLNNECWGANKNRNIKFNCSFVKNGQIVEGGMRNKYDQTGQMKILID